MTTAIAGVAACSGGACDSKGDLIVCVNGGVTMALISAVQCQWIFNGQCRKFYDSVTPEFRIEVTASYTLVVDFQADGGVDLYFQADIDVRVSGTFDACVARGTYATSYPPGAFPCTGPWTLDQTDLVGFISCTDTFPATVTLSAAGGPAAEGDPAIWHDCCPDTPPPTFPTYACVTPGSPCVDPGDESGHVSNEDCLAACVSACPTPPCGDGSSDGGGDVTGLGCCDRGETVERSLHYAAVSTGGSGCFEATGSLVWSDGFKVWIANQIACGAFITYAVFCNGATWCLRIWINGVLAVSIDGDYATCSGNCTPLDVRWSIDFTGVPAAAGIVTGAFDFHVWEGAGCP